MSHPIASSVHSPVPPPDGKYGVTTRWDELMHFLQLVTRIGAELAGEVDFHFLNAGAVEKVEAWEQVAPVAARLRRHQASAGQQ